MINIFKVFTLVLFVGCAAEKRKADVASYCTGKFSDQRGLDGCSWIIIIDKSTEEGIIKYEPVNLYEFGVKPKDQMPIRFTFQSFDGNSVCMVGKLIQLKTLSEIKD